MRVNVITGFLGVGKTTAILHLINQKPDDETWVVLVNEFGEIGIDGALLRGSRDVANEVEIVEVAGGCLCCTAGISLELTLSQIIFLYKPDRLLIEPTGLGHPEEVLQLLSLPTYRDQLTIEQTLTIVDPRDVNRIAVCEHPSFIQQLNMADRIIVNKCDLATSEEIAAVEVLVDKHSDRKPKVLFVSQGKVPKNLLHEPTHWRPPKDLIAQDKNTSLDDFAEVALPETGFLKAQNSGEGFETVGWRISSEQAFNYHKIFSFLSGLAVERMKAVVITNRGVYGYNLARDVLQEIELDDALESRIEIITESVSSFWDKQLESCLE